MKNKINYVFLIFFVVLFNDLVCQQVTFEFIKKHNDDIYLQDIFENNQENIFISCELSKPNDNTLTKGIIYKMNHTGLIIDSVIIDYSPKSFIIHNVIQYQNENFILNGMSSDPDNYGSNSKIHFFKFNYNLEITNQKTYIFPDSCKNSYLKIRHCSDGNFIGVGQFIPPRKFFNKLYLFKISSHLDSIKMRLFYEYENMMGIEVKELPSGDYWVITGISHKYLKVDSLFDSIVQISKTPHLLTANYSFKWDTDTSFYLAADYFSGEKSNYNLKSKNSRLITDHDIGLLRQYSPFDTSKYIFNYIGAIDTFDFPAFVEGLDYLNKDSIFIGSNKNLQWGNIIYGTIPSWFRLVQTDSMLNIRWERFYGGDAYYNMTKVTATNDGGCIMAGTRFDYINHPNLHKRDIFILKVNSEGLLTSSNGKPSPLVHNAIVYPNPGKNTIRVRVAVQYKYSLFRLFNINGKVVITQNITGNSAIINTDFLPSGTYIYKITGKNGLYESGKWIKKGD